MSKKKKEKQETISVTFDGKEYVLSRTQEVKLARELLQGFHALGKLGETLLWAQSSMVLDVARSTNVDKSSAESPNSPANLKIKLSSLEEKIQPILNHAIGAHTSEARDGLINALLKKIDTGQNSESRAVPTPTIAEIRSRIAKMEAQLDKRSIGH